MNRYDTATGKDLGTSNNITACNDLSANTRIAGRHLDITSTFLCDTTAPNMYTKLHADNFLHHNTDYSFIFYDYTYHHNVYSDGITSHSTQMICYRTHRLG